MLCLSFVLGAVYDIHGRYLFSFFLCGPSYCACTGGSDSVFDCNLRIHYLK